MIVPDTSSPDLTPFSTTIPAKPARPPVDLARIRRPKLRRVSRIFCAARASAPTCDRCSIELSILFTDGDGHQRYECAGCGHTQRSAVRP
jgi:hypothetical protein